MEQCEWGACPNGITRKRGRSRRACRIFRTKQQRGKERVAAMLVGPSPYEVPIHIVVMHRRGERADSTCAQCRAHPEDFAHILRCGHADRAKWRRSLLRTLRKVLDDHGADPGLQDLLVDGLESWFHGHHVPSVRYPARFTDLFVSQTSIGWEHIFRGRVSVYWTALQRGYRAGRPGVRSDDTRLGDTIVTTVRRAWDTLWEARNGNLHGVDEVSRRARARAEVESRIRQIYARRQEYLPADRRVLRDSAEEHLRHTTTTALQRWLAVHAAMFHQSALEAARLAINGVRAIWTFFPSREGGQQNFLPQPSAAPERELAGP